jgi:hypothetical protein
LKACSGAQKIGYCEKWAKTMFRALRAFGGLAYRCDNSAVSYY